MKNSYIFKVWRTNKFFCVILLIFLLGQLFFSYKQVETIPFFNYGMYSEPCPKQTSYTTFAIYTEKGERINLYNSPSPFFMHYQLNYYAQLIKQDSIDPIIHTIESRFGVATTFSRYLTKFLSNSKGSLTTAPIYLSNRLKLKNISIKQENYDWVNNNFKKVSQKTFINANKR
ncbi:hypothetical protein [Aureispira anguillae]|uniref:Uncharacterized protein n=1 Tax=Aureispira anguillae TaxID=2864201 RepID=A0A915YDQ8_9BACT|nr:hypothetical protein [Aureispira anguillae]BDS11146.1 hypothetical protein AsAng_0018570 [Aureispira anguillae]